MMQFLPEELLA
jgi:signal transduction histidine kinase